MGKDRKELEEKIGYNFQNKEQLKLAVTHSSYANEIVRKNAKKEYNERIEFLGDAVLELIVSDYLYKNYPEKKEGELTKLRASLVCEMSLAACARNIQLGDYILLSKGEDHTGGRYRDSILSDAFEAVLGAIYIDGGMEPARAFIQKELLIDIEHKALFHDAKTTLQEIVQGMKPPKTLCYELIEESGPAHKREFHVVTKLDDEIQCQGCGGTKKAAEQMAAYQTILKLQDK